MGPRGSRTNLKAGADGHVWCTIATLPASFVTGAEPRVASGSSALRSVRLIPYVLRLCDQRLSFDSCATSISVIKDFVLTCLFGSTDILISLIRHGMSRWASLGRFDNQHAGLLLMMFPSNSGRILVASFAKHRTSRMVGVDVSCQVMVTC